MREREGKVSAISVMVNTFSIIVFYYYSNVKGEATENSTFFKESTPHSRTYELRGHGKKKHVRNQRRTNTSQCPTKTSLRLIVMTVL